MENTVLNKVAQAEKNQILHVLLCSDVFFLALILRHKCVDLGMVMCRGQERRKGSRRDKGGSKGGDRDQLNTCDLKVEKRIQIVQS